MNFHITHLNSSQQHNKLENYCLDTVAFNICALEQNNSKQNKMKSNLIFNSWNEHNWNLTFEFMQQKKDYYEKSEGLTEK